MSLSHVYDKLNDTESRSWRRNVANILIALVGVAVFTLVAMFTGWPRLGALAWSADLDTRIKAQTEPLKVQLEQVAVKQDSQQRSIEEINKLVISGIAERYEANIVQYKAAMCKATTDEARTTWRDLVLEYQRRYFDLTGLTYLAPGCAEL